MIFNSLALKLGTSLVIFGISALTPLIYSSSKPLSGGGHRLASRNLKRSETGTVIDQISKPIYELGKKSDPRLSSMRRDSFIKSPDYLIEHEEGQSDSKGKLIESASKKSTAINLDQERYQKFVSDVIDSLKGLLWWDKRFEHLWIYKVEAIFPRDVLELSEYKFISKEEEKVYNTQGLKLDSDLTETTKVVMEISPEELKNIPSSELEVPTSLLEKLNERSNLAYHFFERNWGFKNNKSLNLPSDKISLKWAETDFKVRKNDEDSENPYRKYVLRFTRLFENRHYHLDLYFYSRSGENQLKVQLVNYKDKNWYSSAFYQANGSWSRYRNHIGGDGKRAKDMGQTWTEVDEDFSKMFDVLDTKPEIALKFFSSVSKCLKDSECSSLFHRDDCLVLNQRSQGFSRSISWNPLYYRNIHPFSKIYYDSVNHLVV